MIIGYARISTTFQTFDTQVSALKRYGVDERNIYQEQISGAATKRPELEKALGFLIKGDTFVVNKLDRLARSLEHLIKLFNSFKEKGVDFVSLTEKIDTTTATGKMHFHMAAAFCEFERNLISERTKEGLDRARKNGRILGRQTILSPQQQKVRLLNTLELNLELLYIII
jgi:DNA invertase Pin-like site-specific DNA recombinase